jgi:hypothetical protein
LFPFHFRYLRFQSLKLNLTLLFSGKSDCPYFARVELLGDRLSKNLPSFKLHKIVKTPDEWQVTKTFLNNHKITIKVLMIIIIKMLISN